jgi:hypothetical protein
MPSFLITGQYRLIIDAKDAEQAQDFFEAGNYPFSEVEIDQDNFEVEPCDGGEY